MLKVSNLTKNYGNLQVLKGISFEIRKGMIYGFLGQNGAGKTTTINILTGLINYNSGEIFLDGKQISNNRKQLLKKVGYLPQNPVFYNYMNALEYLNFIAEVGGMNKDIVNNRSEEVLELVGLKHAAKRRIGGYSGGMKQRLGIAVAIFNKPEILFLDEPTSALDPEGRLEVIELIENLKREGTTVFLSTHILNDIERICDEVSILHEGKIIVSESLDNLKNKYIKPIFDVEFEKNCANIINKLEGKRWIQKTAINKNYASIYVRDINAAKKELINNLIDENNSIVAFNLRKSTLEDIFIRLVNNDGGI